MSLIPSGFAKSAAAGGFYDHPIEQSLRLNDDDSAYLLSSGVSSTISTYTWSAWVKRGNQGMYTSMFGHVNSSNGAKLHFIINNDDRFRIWDNTAGDATRYGARYLRDSSAWYHIVVKVNAGVPSLYVNGELDTTWSGTLTSISSGDKLIISSYGAASWYWDGNMAEVHFVDGTALDASSFGETKSGVWIPKAYAGSYGNNGFYLPFNHDYSVEGFSAVTYRGNGGTQYIGGVGFEPDLVWIKQRTDASNHKLFDSIRGATKELESSTTDAEATQTNMLTSFDSDGFTIGDSNAVNGSNDQIVAWCWDAGSGSPVSNTDGSITSTVKASTDYGFSIVSWTGNGTNPSTVGHGLSSAPEMMIVKNRDTAGTNWIVYHKGIASDAETDYLILDSTNAATDSASVWADTAPTSSVFTVGSAGSVNNSGADFITYCFHSVSGYSKFGSYTGTGASGNSVTTGFKPAFVMVKRTSGADSWLIMDSTRNPVNTVDHTLAANSSGAEDADTGGIPTDFDATGFTLQGTGGDFNGSGETYIYMAFADKREAAFWLDQSGNNNDFENNNLTESDISLDSPTNNFATLNVLDPVGTGTISEGNLKVTGANYLRRKANWWFGEGGIKTGKWYWEIANVGSSYGTDIGVLSDVTEGGGENANATNKSRFRLGSSYKDYTASSGSSYSSPSYSSGDVCGIALDLESGTQTISYYHNNTLVHTDSTIGSAPVLVPYVSSTNGSWPDTYFNFGQDSSFAGNKTAQGNTDDNGYGDFYYAPPTGYLALCTANLTVPDAMNPALDNSPQDYFNTVLYTGTGTTNAITGVGFQPDFVWTKLRSQAGSHSLADVIRGGTLVLRSDLTDAEATRANHIQSFDTDGFTLAGDGTSNLNSTTNVAWNWKANGSGVSNTDGSITSTVSANTDAGFSIVSYTGTGANATVGHGLNSAPEMIIVKNRDTAYNWVVYSESIPNTQYLVLNSTQAVDTFTPMWNSTSPTSSVFSLGYFAWVNGSSADHVAYCFHSVEGFSKFGSYTGNGSTDGTFVYTGFRPAFVMVKRTNTTGDWELWDTTRDSYNVSGYALLPNSSQADSYYAAVDILSNGFKLRDGSLSWNASGSTYIYIAFSSNPFKFSTAR